MLTLGRLLSYAADRLPELRQGYLDGEIRGKLSGRPVRTDLSRQELNELEGLMRPVLFDFKERGQPIRLCVVQ